MRLFAILLLLLPEVVDAQSARPIPYPVQPPEHYQEAVERGTRSENGAPGEAYWTNYATYDIDATLRPSENLLVGRGRVRYENRSPDVLTDVMVHLRQNLFLPEAQRNWPIGETTSGMVMTEVAVNDVALEARPPNAGSGYSVQGTVMRITLPEPVQSGQTVDLAFAWHFNIPRDAPRMGRDSTAYFLGYWYPQIAVYDDLRGWDAQQYLGSGEFYMEFADYDVRIRAPEGWLIPGAGLLQNEREVLAPAVVDRLADARRSTEVVTVVDEAQRGAGTATIDAPDDTLTWHYRAERVRDFAFGASPRFVWDAVAAGVGDADGDGAPDTAMVHSFYRPEMSMWTQVAEFGQFALEYLSGVFMPYPYPQATAVEGPFPFGGIEFPTITLMGGNPPPRALFEMTVHEFAHNWWPMVVGSNEKRYMWQDEGLTHFSTQLVGDAYYEGWQSLNPDAIYLQIAGTETPIMRHADLYPTLYELLVAIYPKPKMAIDLLGGLYGPERTLDAIRTYSERWAFRHPAPWDLFATFEDVLGEDLDWLWRSWFYENWALDQAVAGAEETDAGILVRVRDEGMAPMPTPVTVTYADGSERSQTLPVSAWLAGNREATLLFPGGEVARVEVDPVGFMPDVNRGNNVWTAAP